MTPNEIQTCFEENDSPFVIMTTGGRSCRVTDRANVWIPAAYQTTLCVATVGKGIALVKSSAVESIHIEHDIAGDR